MIDDKEDSWEQSLLKFIGWILFIPVVVLLYGWTFSVHWEWWLVPLGAPSISLMHSYGIVCAFGFLRANTIHKTEDKKTISIVVGTLITPLISLGIGWLVHYSMLQGY